MTYDATLEIAGDCWTNTAVFRQKLEELSHKHTVTIDLRSEGPSLVALGVTAVIDRWCANTGRRPESVVLARWSNPVEWVPYSRSEFNALSHFFPMSIDYWHNNPPRVLETGEQTYLFGFFVGRLTPARSVLMFESGTELRELVLTSMMKSRGHWPWDTDSSQDVQLEKYSDWMSLQKLMRMVRWYQQQCPDSIDGLTVQDQFSTPTSYATTNASLLQHYHRFAIELVAETYTLGNTFFPTEKTVRPVMACKPMVVYGPRYFLARLREMGFETWHELWDEGYDLFEGPERWQRIKQTMRFVRRSSPERQREILFQAQTICNNNRKKLLDIVQRSRIVSKDILASVQ